MLCIICLSSCAENIVLNVPAENRDYSIDFRSYEERGFVFTTEGYEGSHESKGVVEVQMFPRMNRSCVNCTWKIGELNTGDLIDKAYQRAVSLDADAIINFEIKDVQRTVKGVTLPGVAIAGLAIKRN